MINTIWNFLIKLITKFLNKQKAAETDMPDNKGNYTVQSGVIPYLIENEKIKIIIITNRNKKKWILPKGFIDKGLTPSESAQKEALEEAGITGTISENAVGCYEYSRNTQNYKVYLYPMKIESIQNDWPEFLERERAIIDIEQIKDYIRDEGIRGLIDRYFHSEYFK